MFLWELRTGFLMELANHFQQTRNEIRDSRYLHPGAGDLFF
jgi:hypothetical protein